MWQKIGRISEAATMLPQFYHIRIDRRAESELISALTIPIFGAVIRSREAASPQLSTV
jgi:hypothetical protein